MLPTGIFMPQSVQPAAGTAPPQTPSPRTRGRLWHLLILLPVAAVVYAASFRDLPIIDRQHSVLADADAANFKLLVERFGLSRQLGDPYDAVDRSVEDNAQKHKIHHVLYAIVAHPLYLGLRALERIAGLGGDRAVYSVNAVITVINLVLLFLLLRQLGRPGNPAWPFLLLYAGSLSTWLYAAVPESWPFSGTLVLLFFLLLESTRAGPAALASLVGIAMLNNMTLIGLLAPLWLRESARRPHLGATVAMTLGTGLLTVLVWLVSLTALGLFDPTLRPDRFLHYTLWFKEFVEADLPLWSPYVWKAALTNLFLNSFASNQGDPKVPPETLLYTFQQSWLGTMTVAAIVVLFLVTAYRALREGTLGKGRVAIAADPSSRLVLYCVVQVAVTVVMYYGAGFLYSPTVVPLIILLVARHLDLARLPDRAVLAAAVLLLLVNNTDQVLTFRSALAALE